MKKPKYIRARVAKPPEDVGEILLQFEERMYGYVRHKLNNNDEQAGDILQTVISKILKNTDSPLAHLHERNRQWGYLKVSLDHAISTRWTDEKEYQENVLEELTENIPSDLNGSSMEDYVERKLVVESILRHLPDLEVQILQFWSMGFTQQEIAEELGLSRNTVGIHFRHAKEQLAQMGYELERGSQE